MLLGAIVFGSGRADAATLNVTGGCTLPIAIDSVNAGANQSGCTATGAAYGTSDTITIPAGTITLTADLPTITEDVVIQGAGMTQTTISGDNGQREIFDIGTSSPLNVTIEDLQITGFRGFAIRSLNSNGILNNIEIDGQGSNPNLDYVIWFRVTTSGTYSVDVNNIYAHSIDTNGGNTVLRVEQEGSGTINADIDNVTISSIHSTSIGDSLFGIISLAMNGTVNTVISNTTIDDITGEDNVIPFGSFGATMIGNSATVTTDVQNVTITGMRGKTGTGGSAGIKSGAFYSASAAMQPGDQARATVNVTNSLMADNVNDSESSNCTEADMTSLIGGSGTDSIAVINSLGHNISDDGSCTSFTEEGDQQNIGNIISTLGPLQNNGGSVPTRALLTGSPAIASGAAVLGVTTDARGTARPGTCPSVGAYQFVGAVCGSSTPTASGGNAAAPSTGVGSASSVFSLLAGLTGLGIVVVLLRKKIVQ